MKDNWFYIIWKQKHIKTNGLTTFGSKGASKPMLLRHLGPKTNQNQSFYNIWRREPIKTNEKTLVLQHLEAKTNKNQWFCNIWELKPIKTIAFATFGS